MWPPSEIFRYQGSKKAPEASKPPLLKQRIFESLGPALEGFYGPVEKLLRREAEDCMEVTKKPQGARSYTTETLSALVLHSAVIDSVVKNAYPIVFYDRAHIRRGTLTFAEGVSYKGPLYGQPLSAKRRFVDLSRVHRPAMEEDAAIGPTKITELIKRVFGSQAELLQIEGDYPYAAIALEVNPPGRDISLEFSRPVRGGSFRTKTIRLADDGTFEVPQEMRAPVRLAPVALDLKSLIHFLNEPLIN